MAVALHKSYVLGEFELDANKYVLRHHNSSVHLPELPFQVLLYLIEHRERYVSRQELLERFWQGSDAYEETLTKCISTIRTQLNDPPNAPHFIETRKKVGYRYIGPFQERVPTAALVEPPIVEIEHTRALGIAIEEEDDQLRPAKVIPAQLISGKQRPLWKSPSVLVAASLVVSVLIVAGFLVQSRWLRPTADGSKSIRSIAVLPLENMSGDPAQDYFADGMTEELITEIAKIGSLRVISRTSVVQYKGTRKPLPEIARELNVDGIVAGAIIRSGGRIRITAQLINAATDEHIWAESYERDLSDVLSLQSEVARGIANQINVTLTRQEEGLLARKAPISPAASDAYLKALYYFNEERNTMQTEQRKQFFLKSVEFYEQAIKIQPDYAEAYAGLARANHWMGVPFYTQAKDAAIKALQLDETLAEAHGALAYTIFGRDWDWAGAEREYKRAIELNPSYSEAHHGYALYLSAAGRSAEAITEIRRAESLDPLEIPTKHNVARIYLEARKYDEALQVLRTILDMRPDDPYPHFLRGLTLIRKGIYAEALAELQKASTLGGEDGPAKSLIALTYAESGKRNQALKELSKINGAFRVTRYSPGVPMLVATTYSILGEKDEAFKCLNQAYDAHAPSLLYIRTFPEFDNLNSDPRFAELLRRIGFPS